MRSIIKGYFSIILSVLICISAFFIFIPKANAEETNDNTEIKYTEIHLDFSEDETSKNIRTRLQNAFNEARDYATPYNQYKIILPENMTLKISGNIGIYSNTYFDLNGSTIVRDYSTSNIMFKAGREIPAYGYEGYGNITITNGTIDGWDNEKEPSTSPLMRWGHSQNILFENLTFVDNWNTHCVEIAASKNFTIRNCIFKDQHLTEGETSPGEVIQIDALQSDGFPLYDYYDGTSCNNINIDNCTFENVTRGIGTHSVILGESSYYKNINITNCTFNKVSDYCIVSLCWIDIKIQNNKITNCENGILIRTMRSDFERMFDGDFTKPISDYNTLIENNTIDTNKNAVKLYGVNVPNNVNWSLSENVKGTVPAGDYALSNVKVLNNNITCKATAVALYHTKTSEISGNTVNVNTSDSNKAGIYLTQNSFNNIITNNNINNLKASVIKAGILLSGSQKNNIIKGNTISGKTNNAIFLYNGSNNTTITENTVKNSVSTGIYTHSSEKVTVTLNTVSADSGDGIYFASKSTTPSVQNNQVTLSDQSSCIGVNNSTATTIKNNTVKKGLNGIYIKNSTTNTITKNTTDSSTYGVYVKNSKTEISGNYLNNSKSYGIYTESTAEATIYTNSFTQNKKGNILLEGSEDVVAGNLGTPKNFSNKATAYNQTTLSWKKPAYAVYHRVYKSTDNKSFKFLKSSKRNATSYTDTNLTPGKKYYYQIVPVIYNGKTYVIGNTSEKNNSTTGVVSSSLEYVNQNHTPRVFIKWKTDFTPENYEIYRKESKENKYKLIRTVDGTARGCYDGSIEPGKVYYYKVRQTCYDGNKKLMTGKVSNVIKIAPKVLTGDISKLKRKNKSKIYVSVKDNFVNKGYRIFYSKNKDKGYKQIGTIDLSKSDHTYLNLKKGKYYIKVQAYTRIKNKTYYGSYSAVKKIKK